MSSSTSLPRFPLSELPAVLAQTRFGVFSEACLLVALSSGMERPNTAPAFVKAIQRRTSEGSFAPIFAYVNDSFVQPYIHVDPNRTTVVYRLVHPKSFVSYTLSISLSRPGRSSRSGNAGSHAQTRSRSKRGGLRTSNNMAVSGPTAAPSGGGQFAIVQVSERLSESEQGRLHQCLCDVGASVVPDGPYGRSHIADVARVMRTMLRELLFDPVVMTLYSTPLTTPPTSYIAAVGLGVAAAAASVVAVRAILRRGGAVAAIEGAAPPTL